MFLAMYTKLCFGTVVIFLCIYMLSWLHNTLPNEILVDLGFISVHWYGFLVTLGVVSGLLVVRYLWVSYLPLYKGESPDKVGARGSARIPSSGSPLSKGGGLDHLYNLLFYTVIFGLIGARAWHMLNEPVYYWQNPLDAFAIWNGGLAWHGGLAAGVLTAYVYVKRQGRSLFSRISNSPNCLISNKIQNSKSQIRNKLLNYPVTQLLFLADILAPALAVGQAVGRWGNYFNQELFGNPTNLPWGIPIALENRRSGFESFEFFHPTFLYESLALLLLFLVLMWMHQKRQKNIKTQEHKNIVSNVKCQMSIVRQPGFIFALYLISSSVIRVLLELIRIDRTPIILGLRLPVITGVVLIIVAVIWLWYNRKVIGALKH